MSWQSHALQLLYLLTPAVSAVFFAGQAVLLVTYPYGRLSRREALVGVVWVVLALLNLWVCVQVAGVYAARQTLG